MNRGGKREEEEEGDMLVCWRNSQQGPAGSAIRTARGGLTQHAGCFAEHHLPNARLSLWRAGRVWSVSLRWVCISSNQHVLLAAPWHGARARGKGDLM